MLRRRRVAPAAAGGGARPPAVQVAFSAASAAALADELERELRDLLAAWLPRCIDEQHGGFLCDFDARWKATGPHVKSLEFQARMTRTLAELAEAYPDEPGYRRAADHGFAFLRDVLWDHEQGGWFRSVDRGGVPLEAGTKHAHGTGYAISACAAHHRLARDAESVELGARAFAWLDACAHDREHGGYFGPLLRDGTVIASGDDSRLEDRVRDVIGTPYGLKDANTMSDVLAGVSDLYEVRPDPVVRERLREMMACVRDRMVVAPGMVSMYVLPDWTSVPDFAHYGQALQTANQLRQGAVALEGSLDARTAATSKALADTVFTYGWDARAGGVYFGGSTYGPVYYGGIRVLVAHKPWWVQAEGLRAALALFRAYPDGEGDYWGRFVALWAYVRAHLIDARYGGWLPIGSDCPEAQASPPKASAWRDSSHEARALLECTAALRACAAR